MERVDLCGKSSKKAFPGNDARAQEIACRDFLTQFWHDLMAQWIPSNFIPLSRSWTHWDSSIMAHTQQQPIQAEKCFHVSSRFVHYKTDNNDLQEFVLVCGPSYWIQPRIQLSGRLSIPPILCRFLLRLDTFWEHILQNFMSNHGDIKVPKKKNWP